MKWKEVMGEQSKQNRFVILYQIQDKDNPVTLKKDWFITYPDSLEGQIQRVLSEGAKNVECYKLGDSINFVQSVKVIEGK